MEVQAEQALGRLVSGLYILSTRNGQGMVVSWVQQASMEPLQLSVALAKERPANEELQVGDLFALSILGEDQQKLMTPFFKSETPFQELASQNTSNGLPVLSEALCHLEAKVTGRFETGDHVLIVGELTEGALNGNGAPASHWRKSGKGY